MLRRLICKLFNQHRHYLVREPEWPDYVHTKCADCGEDWWWSETGIIPLPAPWPRYIENAWLVHSGAVYKCSDTPNDNWLDLSSEEANLN